MVSIDFIVKSKVSEEQFEDIVEEWLSGGAYTPDDIIENIITETNAKLLPVHFYKARFSGIASVSLGFDRTEYYYVYNSTTKKQEQKSRTVTDWRSHSQPVQGEVSACEYAGGPEFSNLADFIDETKWSSSELLQIDGSASVNQELTQLFKFDHNGTWEASAGQRCNKKANKISSSQMPHSDRKRGFQTNLNFEVYYVKSLLLPFWIYSYEYRDKLYHVVVDGNNPERVTGKRPKNAARLATVWGLRLLGWPGGLYASYKVADLFANGPNYSSSSNGDLKTVALFVIGFILTLIIIEGPIRMIKQASQKKRDEKLKRKRENRSRKLGLIDRDRS